MASCEKEIWDYVSQIEPTEAQKNGAQRSHAYLRDILCTGQFASRIRNSYLSGSYARDTAIAPLDDVDIIFVVNPNAWPRTVLSPAPTPSVILDSFARAIRYRYPTSSIRTQRRSICLKLYHLDIDVVPAIDDDALGNVIWIPDADTGRWIKSAPKLHSAKATEINQLRGGRFKPLVKLLKRWNANLPQTATLKSFVIETMAARLFSVISLPSLEDGLALFFDFVASLGGQARLYRWSSTYGIAWTGLGVNIPDLAGTGNNLAATVDAQRRKRFVDLSVISRNRMADARAAAGLTAACGKVTEALRLN